MLDDLPYEQIWCGDFEYNGHDGGNRQNPVCLVAIEARTRQEIRLWRGEFGSQAPFPTGPRSLFVSFSAGAELHCFRSLSWKFPERILDLYVEHKAAFNGRPTLVKDPKIRRNSLLHTLLDYGLTGMTSETKEEMRRLVVEQDAWDTAQQRAVFDYCALDVLALLQLLPVMLSHIDLPRALLRGRFMGVVAHLEFNGIPIDTKTLSRLRSSWESLQAALIADTDPQYGVYDGTVFKREWFAAYLTRNQIPWPRLATGVLQLDDDTFAERTRRFPILRPLRKLRSLLADLRLHELTVGRDGRARCWPAPFASTTSRSQPSGSQFIFLLSRWLRMLIHPEPDHGLIYCDWSAQEIGIAAHLANDAALMEAYTSHDPYIVFARQAKAVPPDATKDSHGKERELFKQALLSAGYGITGEALALKLEQPPIVGHDLLRAHRNLYRDYWKWAEASVNTALLTRRLTTVFGWPLHVNKDPNPRSLLNFGAQANGAECMRLAACLAVEHGLELCATVHDGFLLTAPLSQLDEASRTMCDCMREASRIVLDGFELRVDVKTFRSRYQETHGLPMWNRMMTLLDQVEIEGRAAA